MNQRFNQRRTFNPRAKRSAQSTFNLIAEIKNAQYKSANVASLPQVAYTPKHTFADFPFDARVQANIAAKGYLIPTPIQDESIMPIIEGRDLIGIANTGTGKTAAFLLPIINKMLADKTQKALIVAPTRELALQIYEEGRAFAKGLGLRAVLCIGGMAMGRQQQELRYEHQFVIGTPGRIKDHLKQNSLNLSNFHTVVLDETDRMVDIGFIGDIKYFISLLPKDRQSLFFSATVSGAVREILATFVKNPITISVKIQETASTITQDLIKIVDKSKKVDQLHDLLIQDGFDKVLIFGRTKWGVQKLADELGKRGFRAGAIHGNKRQNQRQQTLDAFKNNQIQVLLATDVASRGLDINDVSHVINYDLPESYEDYVHRIGRTGRANKQGIALTFVD